MTKVYIIESESGWGQKVDETKRFPNKDAAIKFCVDYNRKYNPPKKQAPSWYMFARIEGEEGTCR